MSLINIIMARLKTNLRRWFGQAEISISSVADEAARLNLSYEFAKNKIITQVDNATTYVLSTNGTTSNTDDWEVLTDGAIGDYPPADDVQNVVDAVELTDRVKASGELTFTGDTSDHKLGIEIEGDVIWFRTATGVFVGSAIIYTAPISSTDAATSVKELIEGKTPSVSGVTFEYREEDMFSSVGASVAGSVVTVTANEGGEDGNSITTIETLTNASWGAATLEGGLDSELSGVVRYDQPQSLSVPEKSEARANINAASLDGNILVNQTLEKADHLWMMNEDTGDFIDFIGSETLTNTNTVPSAVANPSFYKSRAFVASSSQKGAGSSINTDGEPFWFAIGVKFESTIAASRGIAGQADPSGVQWLLRRLNNTELSFYCTSASGTGSSEVVVAGITDSEYYNVIVRFDGTNLWMHVGGVDDAYSDASIGLSAVNKPFDLGHARGSATLITNYHDGDIGWAAYGHGHITESDISNLLKSDRSDWKCSSRTFSGMASFGDSLTTSAYADPSWVKRVESDTDKIDLGELHGVGGESSPGTLARMSEFPLSNIKRGVVAIWSGNNNPTPSSQPIADITAMRQIAEDAGARQIVLMGVPNRSVVGSSQAVVDALQVDLDSINAALSAIATLNDNTVFIDLHDEFVNPSKYTPVDGDDVADQTLGVVPRSARDTPSSPSSTHLGNLGAQHVADAVVAAI